MIDVAEIIERMDHAYMNSGERVGSIMLHESCIDDMRQDRRLQFAFDMDFPEGQHLTNAQIEVALEKLLGVQVEINKDGADG